MKRVINLLFIILLFTCEQPKKPVNSSADHVENGSSIVFLNSYYAHYLSDLKAGYNNVDSLYNDEIRTPITKYFSSSEYPWLISSQFYVPLKDTNGLSFRITLLEKNKGKIEDIIATALLKCNRYLKDDSITIYIQPMEIPNKVVTRMGGVVGLTGGSKKILITIDPSVSSWNEWLAYTVTHEFHHAYWTEMNFRKINSWTMLDYLVFEGRADSYAQYIYPSKIPQWDIALSQQQKVNLWANLKTKLDTTDMAFEREIMFGNNEYPSWGGYCLGYSIVQSALKINPKLTPEQWTNMSPKKILEMSGYK